jgi:uncharacterized repeat protein (TIGR03803 family)
MDAVGNLYGTTYTDGAYQFGSVFKLTPRNGGWTYTSLHDFTDGDDGDLPFGGPTMDGNGNLYGTTTTGGMRGAIALPSAAALSGRSRRELKSGARLRPASWLTAVVCVVSFSR